jgi:hypothetical protein
MEMLCPFYQTNINKWWLWFMVAGIKQYNHNKSTHFHPTTGQKFTFGKYNPSL